MAQQYPMEVKAIRTLRAKYPQVPAKTLARQIAERGFDTVEDQIVAGTASYQGMRPYYSIYSVIRRFDAKQKQAAVA